MSNRTYRYFKGEALYPFGYGLSYSSFKYDALKIPGSSTAGKNITASVAVTNTGKIAGDEVVQLYVSHQGTEGRVPVKALKGFQRINLKPGERKVVTFRLTPEQLSLVADDGKTFQPKGKTTISIGGGQPGATRKTTSNVVTGSINIL